MAYTILNTDGTVLLLLADGQVDKSTTSLSLIGRNYPSYGQDLNNNFVKLLANFASVVGNPPRSPLTGQLWYDTTSKRLKIYDNGFKTIGAVRISTTEPSDLQSGDLWFDDSTKQLKIVSSTVTYNVGPVFPSYVGSSGFTLPETTVNDQDGAAKEVLLLRSYGNSVGVLYFDETGQDLPFEMDSSDRTTFIPNATTSTVVSGLTITGDLNVQGKVSNSYLSLGVDIDVISPAPNNDVLAFSGTYDPVTGINAATGKQNPEIVKILNQIYPVNATTLTSTSTVMTGVLLGTQARVLCKFSVINGVARTGYQARVFRTVGTHQNASWQPYYYTTSTFGPSGINYISTTTN